MVTYSIIIATYNRLEELVELFDSLDSVEFDPSLFEVVIIDDGSTDQTQAFIASLIKPFGIQYHRQENQGPGAARNFGMKVAQGDYFIFIDSDVLLPSNYLSAIDRYLSQNDVLAFGGPDNAHPSFSPMLKAINYSMTSFIGTGGTRGSKKSVTRFYPRSFNMGIHKSVFEKIGGMGGLRHGQDMDYSARIYDAGFKVGFIPDAVVFHKRRTNLRKFYKQIFNWGVARINLGRKYSYMMKPIYLAPAFLVVATITVVILYFIFPVLWPIVSFGIWLAFFIAVFAFIQSLSRNGSVVVAFLSIITLYTQVIAYGLGTLSGVMQYFSGKKEAKGFVKKYYE